MFMYRIGILTDNLEEDFHSAELFEEASNRANAYYIRPRELELTISRNTPLIKAGKISLYDLDALIVRHLDGNFDTDLQFDLLSQLQQSGVLLVNSCQSLQISESKALTHYLLSLYGLPVVESLSTQEPAKAFRFASRFCDAIIKPLYGQLGEDVLRLSELQNPEQEIAAFIDNYGSVNVQQYVEAGGRDKRVFVIDDHVSAVIERQAQEGWKSNIFQGAKAQKIELSKNLRDLAVKASQIIGLSYSGIDFISGNGRTYILELNGSAAWSGVEEATGKNIAAEIISFVLRKLEKRRKTGQFISS